MFCAQQTNRKSGGRDVHGLSATHLDHETDKEGDWSKKSGCRNPGVQMFRRTDEGSHGLSADAIGGVDNEWGKGGATPRFQTPKEMEGGGSEKARRMWRILSTALKHSVDKVKRTGVQCGLLTHGLQHLRHFTCLDPVRHVTHGAGATGFLSLHNSGGVRLYHSDGRLRNTLSSPVPFVGLMCTQLPGRLVGWGPGASLTLLDADLRPLTSAPDPLDVRVCQPTVHSLELVTAGMQNVCVWCLTHMVCRVRVVEGLEGHSIFTRLALAPPNAQRPHRAYAACGRSLALIDLTCGRLVEYRRHIHRREITGLVHCLSSDCLITASRDMTIRVWGPDWGLRVAFVGHNGAVTALAYCPESGLLLSASLDGTLRCWSLEERDQVQEVKVEPGAPALALGGPGTGGTFYSFSQRGVDFWVMTSLYGLLCRLSRVPGQPVRQILVPGCPPPYPPRALCVSGDSRLTLVATETGTVLTTLCLEAGQRVMCADYCLPREVLLVLTEDGAVLMASTLTNPVTPLNTWHKEWQESWPSQDRGKCEKRPPGPGRALCLVLYSSIAEPGRALDHWQKLQEQRGQRVWKLKRLQSDKNRFLAVLGQEKGCVTLLQWDTGKIQYRTPAHNGQNVTALQADPENSFLFSAGLSEPPVRSPPVYMAFLGPLLALAIQEPNSATYSMVHFSLLTQSRTDHPPTDDHLDSITGLCACPQPRVFASSSRDGTIRLWDEENHLLRTLQLCAVPECLAYSGEKGDLLMGIWGDLYRVHCAQLLPPDVPLRLLCTEESDSVLSISHSQTEGNTLSSVRPEASPMGDEEAHQEKMPFDPDYVTLLARNRDLEALQQGAVECRKRKPVIPRQIKREAFDRYMKLIYNQPLRTEVPAEDTFAPQATLFPPPHPVALRPLIPPSFFPNKSMAHPVDQTSRVAQDQQSLQDHLAPHSFIPYSALVGQLWSDTAAEASCAAGGLRHKSKSEGGEPAFLTYGDDELDRGSPSDPEIAPRPPEESPPPSPPKPLTPPPPEFLLRFLDQDWFKEIFPDRSLIPRSLRAEEFSLQLLSHLRSCQAGSRMQILSVLLDLRSQGALESSERLRAGLMNVLRTCVSLCRSTAEQQFIGQLLEALASLGPCCRALVVEMLTILSSREMGLQSIVLSLLSAVGVEDALLWLEPEAASWDLGHRGGPSTRAHLRETASGWLDTWTAKYQVWKKQGSLRGTRIRCRGTQGRSTPVDVLNYFCSVMRESLVHPTPPFQERRRDTVLLLPQLYRHQAIQRLGETYSLARKRHTRGEILPPLPGRPFLTGFAPFVSLPLTRVTLGPFPFPEEQHGMEGARPRRYFILEQSYADYYR